MIDFPLVGETKLRGYCGKMVDYTVDNQLCDAKLWANFVNQFRLKSDNDDYGWRGEFWGKMMIGAAFTYRLTKNSRLYSVLSNTVIDLLSVSAEDGYISTYTKEREFTSWNVWSAKYVLMGFEAFFEICRSKTLKKKILCAMTRHADYILEHIGDGDNKISIFDTSGVVGAMNSTSILESMVCMYTLTGKRRYLDFSRYLVESGLCQGC